MKNTARWTSPIKLRRLRVKLTGLLLLQTIVPILLLGLYLTWTTYEAEQESAMELQQAIVNRTVNETMIQTNAVEDKLADFLDTPDLLYQSSERIFLLLSQLSGHKNSRNLNIFSEISLLNRDGRELARVSRTTNYTNQDLEDRATDAAFTIPAASGKNYYSPVAINPNSREPYTTLAVPMVDPRNQEVRAVIVAQIRLSQIWDSIVDRPFGQTGVVFLVDDQGKVVAHPNPSLVLQDKRFPIGAGGKQTGINGSKVIRVSQPFKLGDQLFRVVAERPTQEAFHLFQKILFTMAFASAIFFISAQIALWLVNRKVIRPIELLADAAQTVEAGDLSQRAHLQSETEIGLVATAFNTMLDKLTADIQQRQEAERQARKNEEKYKILVENLPQRIFLKDRQLGYISCNQAFARDLNLLPEAITGKTDLDLFPLDLAEKYRQDDRKAITSGATQAVENSYLLDGQTHTLMTVTVPIKDEQGLVGNLLGISWDITAQKATEQELTRYRNNLEELVQKRTTELEIANRNLKSEIQERLQLEQQLLQAKKMEAIGTLAAGIAHDFNNILNIIFGFLENTKRLPELNGEAADNIAGIATAASRGGALVQQILTFGRQVEQVKKPVPLPPLLKEVIDLQRPTTPDHIRIEHLLLSNCGAVLGDTAQLHQVFQNLYQNAIQAMADKGGTLTISLAEVEIPAELASDYGIKPGRYLKTIFKDQGPGMEPKTMQRIFDPYFSTKIRPAGAGLGLGLAIVHGIVKNHGGAILVKSQLGQGTLFSVYLPLALPTFLTEEVKLPATKSGPKAGRILFVDDEPINLVNWQLAMQYQGFIVKAFTNSQEALAAFQAAPTTFDLLITDQRMQPYKGTELASAMRKLRPDLPVLLISGWTDALDDQEMAAAGIRERLMKPHDLEALLAAIDRTLQPT